MQNLMQIQIRLPGQATYLTCCLRWLSTAICHNIKLHVYTNSTGLPPSPSPPLHCTAGEQTHTGVWGQGGGLPWSDLHFCLDMTSVSGLASLAPLTAFNVSNTFHVPRSQRIIRPRDQSFQQPALHCIHVDIFPLFPSLFSASHRNCKGNKRATNEFGQQMSDTDTATTRTAARETEEPNVEKQ